MMHFRLRDIEWETDGTFPVLPTQCAIECEDEDQIADTLSRLHGWIVSSFVVEGSTLLPVDPGRA